MAHNSLLSAAAPVLAQIDAARSEIAADAALVHADMAQAIQGFILEARNGGFSGHRVRYAAYGLAATADDIILDTAWGRDSDWGQKSMATVFFGDAWGGEQFYQLLAHMLATPDAFMPEIELYYLCLCFGFVGKHRLGQDGRAALGRQRQDLSALLAAWRGPLRPTLSPPWPEPRADPRTGDASPWLALAALCVILATGLPLGLNHLLERDAGRAIAELAELTLPETSPRAIAPKASAPPVAKPRRPLPPETLESVLSPYIQAGLLRLTTNGHEVRLTTTAEMFASASNEMRSPWPEIIGVLGRALSECSCRVHVVGHTDSQPIRSPAYPDNVALSIARARSVARALTAIDPNLRPTATGAGAGEPLTSNATEAGRRANRRVEITLTPR